VREETEQSLRESQRRFEQMAESIDQIFWITDLDSMALVYSSPAIETIWGMSRDVTGTDAIALAYELIVPADLPRLEALFSPSPDSKREARYRIRRRDGRERHLHTRAIPIEVRDGRVSRIMGVTEDVTEAALATMRLQFNQDFERLVTQLASDLANAAPATLDAEIHSALGRLGQFADVDRAAIYAFDEDGLTVSITHEWCADGIVGVKSLLRNVPITEVRWFVERLSAGDVSYLSVDGAPDEMRYEAAMLRRFGVHSRIQVPLVSGTRLVGALVFVMTSPRQKRTQELAATLSIAADLCANALERKRSEATEAAYRGKLRTLAAEVARAEERERRRIALGLHDGAIQNLGLARLRLSQLRRLAASDATIPLFDDAIALIERTTEETRSMVFDFSPPALYELGIAAALEWLSDRTRERYGLECEFVEEGDASGSVEDEVAVTVFQSVRELLLNVHKHANARSAKVILERSRERWAVRVEDDGCGFVDTETTRSAVTDGYGLFSIRERVELLGGTLSVDSGRGRGSVVTLAMPSGFGKEVGT
jgi:PAS domain S-box-containing protein